MAELIKVKEPDPITKLDVRQRIDTEWNALLTKAQKHAGQWFEVTPAYSSPSAASTAAYDINSGRNVSVPEGTWEAASRARLTDDGIVGILFVRYLGA